MTCAGQVKIMGGQVEFAFRLPAGQVEFSGLFLTLETYIKLQEISFFFIHIIKICYARILKVRKHISVIMNILVQSFFGRFSKHFYEKHGKDQVYSLISLLKKIFN